MPANNFRIEGEEVSDQADFLSRESDNTWSGILYMPDTFTPTGSTPIVLKAKTFDQVSFKDTKIQNIRFISCTFCKCLFIGATFDKCEFIDCTFKSTNTSKLRIQQCLISPDNFSDNFDLVADTNIAIDLYHSLYKNAVEEHQPEHAVESLYQMMEAEFKHLDSQRKRKRITRTKYLWQKTGKGIYRFISGYGLRFRRVMRFALLILVGFTAVNYVFREHIFENGIVTIVDALYFTSVTITTLGYGDITPTTQIGKLLVVAQAISGFAVVSIVLVGVANKALRGR
tara:strand:- start:4730 stop:5584 length:855 start_codon:yes stop_codon:yes gene_type:complete